MTGLVQILRNRALRRAFSIPSQAKEIRMATKHVNSNKDASFQSAKGRRGGETPKSSEGGRERNVGHSGAEEHSRTAKGNRGGESRGDR